jgi:hypothetical protein
MGLPLSARLFLGLGTLRPQPQRFWRTLRSSNKMWDDLFPKTLDGLAYLLVRWSCRMPKAEHQVVDPRLVLQCFDLPDAVGG